MVATIAPQEPVPQPVSGKRSPLGWALHALSRHLTACIMGGMVLGVIVGWLVNQQVLSGVMSDEHWARSFQMLSTIFLNLIKMLVAPLVLATIVSGLAHMADSSAVGGSASAQSCGSSSPA
jgi:Na+/H+-dicarboxylate symporter